MEQGFCTEAEVVTQLLVTAKLYDAAPIVIAHKRTGGKNTAQREVTFIIRVATGNEELINKLVGLQISSNRGLWFVGSEVNLQDGQMDVDYIYVTAIIKPNIGA